MFLLGLEPGAQGSVTMWLVLSWGHTRRLELWASQKQSPQRGGVEGAGCLSTEEMRDGRVKRPSCSKAPGTGASEVREPRQDQNSSWGFLGPGKHLYFP